MPDGPGQGSPDLAPAQREGTSAPVERFDPDRFRDELVEAEHLLRYMWAAGAVSDRAVLDAGCGTGYGCALLVENGGARRCLGVDLAEEAIAEARSTYGGDERLEFQVGDVTALHLPDDTGWNMALTPLGATVFSPFCPDLLCPFPPSAPPPQTSNSLPTPPRNSG